MSSLKESKPTQSRVFSNAYSDFFGVCAIVYQLRMTNNQGVDGRKAKLEQGIEKKRCGEKKI